MLAPMDIGIIQNSVKLFYLDICSADKIAHASKSVHIVQLKDEFTWMAALRSRLKILAEAGEEWDRNRIKIISDVATAFVKYANTFEAVEESFVKTSEPWVIVKILDKLIEEIDENIRKITVSNDNYEHCRKQVDISIAALDESIQDCWRQLSASEGKIVQLTEQLVLLQKKILECEQAVAPDSLSSIPISGYKDICSGCATIVNAMVINGLSVPYVSVGVLLFSFGKTIHDIISNTEDFEKANEDMRKYTLNLNREQKELAQTKALIQILGMIKEMDYAQGNALSQIELFWKEEKRNLISVKEKFSTATGSVEGNAEALQMPIALVVWETLKNMANDLLGWVNTSMGSGRTEIQIQI